MSPSQTCKPLSTIQISSEILSIIKDKFVINIKKNKIENKIENRSKVQRNNFNANCFTYLTI